MNDIIDMLNFTRWVKVT